MKKIFLWPLVLIISMSMITVFSLAGCKEVAPVEEEIVEEEVEEAAPEGEEAPAEEVKEEEKPGEVEIKLLFLAGGLNDLAPIIEEKFYELWPDSYIKFSYEFADYATLHDKIAISEAGGAGAYDIYWIITDWMPEFIEAGFLLPLNSYLESDPIDEWPDTYPDTVMEFQTVDGQLYGVPGHDGPYMLFYRTDLFNDETEKADFVAEYGYELAPPETWDQFKDIADFFTRPNEDLYGTSFAGNDPQATPYDLVQVAHSFGAEYWDAGGYPTFNSEIWVNALEFIGTMYEENSPPGAASIDMMGRADWFKEGILAMYADWTGFAGYFEHPEISNVVGKVDYSLMPKGDDNRDSLDIYWCYCISNSSQNKDDAWEVMQVLASPEIDKLWTRAGGGGIGVRKSTITDPEVIEQFPFYKTMGEILDGNAFGSPHSPAAAEIYDLLKIAVQKYLAGEGSAQEVLDEANSKIAEALAELE